MRPKHESFTLRWIFLFLPTPALANLFFFMPPTEPMLPGEVRLDLGATYGHYFIPKRDEDRYYAPDLKCHLQLYKRIAFGLEAYGVARSESQHGDIPFQLAEDTYTGGDLVFTIWLDIRRKQGQWRSLKAFARAKVPSAADTTGSGSDEADIYFGFTSHWAAGPWSSASLARFDIVGRPDQDQWDYLTLATRASYRFSPDFEAFADGWYRFRSTNETSLLSAGINWHLKPGCNLEIMAGDGNHAGFEGNPDSRLERQISIQLKLKIHSQRLASWLQK